MDPRLVKAVELGKRMAKALAARHRWTDDERRLLTEWERYLTTEAPVITVEDMRRRAEYGPIPGQCDLSPEEYERRCLIMLASEVMAPELRWLLEGAVRLNRARVEARKLRAYLEARPVPVDIPEEIYKPFVEAIRL